MQYEDVVIVGPGPVGLAAAAEFANHGILSLIHISEPTRPY